MKNIYIVTSRLLDGGTATVSFNYYQMFKKNGFETKLVVLENLPVSDNYFIDKSDLIQLDIFDGEKSMLTFSNFFSVFKAFRRVSKILRAHDSIFIFVHFLPVFLAAPFSFIKNRSSRYIFTIHTNIFSYLKNSSWLKSIFFRIFMFCLKAGDKIVFLTPDVAQGFIFKYGSPTKVCSIPNFFRPAVENSNHTKIPDCFSKDFILYSGRLSKEKNLDFLIDSFDLYRRKGGKNKLVIAGDGPIADLLVAKVSKMNLTSVVVFLGHINKVDIYYKSASYLVLPSEYEGFGMVLLESIYYNLPVMVSNCYSGPSYILERKNPNELSKFHQNGLGFLLPIPGIADESDYSNYMLLMDSKVISPIERKTCLSYFSEENVYKKWLDIL